MLEIKEDSTESLIARVRGGDVSAEMALYLRFFDPVYRYARLLAPDDESAERLTNDAFTHAVVALPTAPVTDGKALRAWLLRLVRESATPADGSTAAPASDDELAALVVQLPAGERDVVALRYGVGCDDEEIATVLRASVARARELHAGALDSLRRGLRPAVAVA